MTLHLTSFKALMPYFQSNHRLLQDTIPMCSGCRDDLGDWVPLGEAYRKNLGSMQSYDVITLFFCNAVIAW